MFADYHKLFFRFTFPLFCQIPPFFELMKWKYAAKGMYNVDVDFSGSPLTPKCTAAFTSVG